MNAQDIHKYITDIQAEVSRDLKREVMVSFYADGVSISGYVNDKYLYESANAPDIFSARQKFAQILEQHNPSSNELRRRAAELLAKADAMEAGK